MSCGVDSRQGSDLALLWLWCRLAAAALIRPLAWETPHAAGAALKRQKTKKKKKAVTITQRMAVRHRGGRGVGKLIGTASLKNGDEKG